MRQLDALIDDAQELSKRIDGLVAELKLLRKSLRKGEGKVSAPDYLRPDGRLSDAGVRYCQGAFAAGKGPTEIARALGVTVPAVIARRRGWEARQDKSPAEARGGKAGKRRA